MNRRDALKLVGVGALSACASPGAALGPPATVEPVSKEFKECLTDVYEGEVTGEAAFSEMLAEAKTAEQIYVVGSMLQLETEGKATLRPVLQRLGLSMRESQDGRGGGAKGGTHFNTLPWIERFSTLADIIRKKYLPRYLQLGELVSAGQDPDAARVAAFMGRHERAILAASEGIVAGVSDPLAPMVALLRFPLQRPPSGS